MHAKIERLLVLLDYLDDAICSHKKTASVEQVLKAEDINLAENSTLNIQQNQYVIIHQSDKWINEAKEITQDLAGIIPHEGLSLPDAVRHLKSSMANHAMEITGGRKIAAANRLGIERRTLKYILNGN